MATTTALQQLVAIVSVDMINLKATGQTRYQTGCEIDLRLMTGAVHAIPSVGDQWIIQQFAQSWMLVSQLPVMGTELSTLADNPVPGTVQIGSTNPNGQGPLHLNGSLVNLSSPLSLGNYTTATRPDAAVAGAGAIIFDTNVGALMVSNGTSWNQTGSGGGGTIGVAGQSVFGEAPAGGKNGTNLSFTTAQDFVANSTVVFRNGLRELLNISYTEIAPHGIHFSTAPLSDDVIIVDYLGPTAPTATAVFGETPTGAKNGVNQSYTLAHNYVSGSISLYRNSLREQLVANYTEVAPNQIHLVTPPLSSDDLTVDYLASA
jgi:hypothetical protein